MPKRTQPRGLLGRFRQRTQSTEPPTAMMSDATAPTTFPKDQSPSPPKPYVKKLSGTKRRVAPDETRPLAVRGNRRYAAPPMDAAGLPALIEAIRHLHGLEATWLELVPVVETHEGQTVWAGEVQVFAVEHPKATRVYAWSHETDVGKRRFHAVLGAGPVTGAREAVRVAILSEK